MRREEEFCKNCFDGYLRDQLGLLTAWRTGKDPPDHFLTVASATFAVEVTQLFGEVGTDAGASMGDEQYEASMRRVCEAIGQAAIEEGILGGFYLAHFLGPFGRFRRTRKLIIERVLEYIRDAQGATTAPSRVIFAEVAEEMENLGFNAEMVAEAMGRRWIHGSCSIRKHGGSPDMVHCVTGARERVMWEGQVLAEACRQPQEAVCEKRRRLAGVGEAKILLLLHQWPMTDAGIYRGCVKALRFLDSFHSIFVVETVDNGYFLHTQETAWRRAV